MVDSMLGDAPNAEAGVNHRHPVLKPADDSDMAWLALELDGDDVTRADAVLRDRLAKLLLKALIKGIRVRCMRVVGPVMDRDAGASGGHDQEADTVQRPLCSTLVDERDAQPLPSRFVQTDDSCRQ